MNIIIIDGMRLNITASGALYVPYMIVQCVARHSAIMFRLIPDCHT